MSWYAYKKCFCIECGHEFVCSIDTLTLAMSNGFCPICGSQNVKANDTDSDLRSVMEQLLKLE